MCDGSRSVSLYVYGVFWRNHDKPLSVYRPSFVRGDKAVEYLARIMNIDIAKEYVML